MNPLYQTQLNKLLTDPSSFTATPGYNFAVEQGMKGLQRSAAAKGQMGSGNVLADLMKYGQGMASQEYGNQVDRLGRLTGQEQQYGLGQRQADTAQFGAQTQRDLGFGRLGLDTELGRGNLALGGRQADTSQYGAETQRGLGMLGAGTNQYGAETQRGLGLGNLALGGRQADTAQYGAETTRQTNQGQLGLGAYSAANQYALGSEQNRNQMLSSLMNYDLGAGKLGLDTTNSENQFNIEKYKAEQAARGGQLNAMLSLSKGNW